MSWLKRKHSETSRITPSIVRVYVSIHYYYSLFLRKQSRTKAVIKPGSRTLTSAFNANRKSLTHINTQNITNNSIFLNKQTCTIKQRIKSAICLSLEVRGGDLLHISTSVWRKGMLQDHGHSYMTIILRYSL